MRIRYDYFWFLKFQIFNCQDSQRFEMLQHTKFGQNWLNRGWDMVIIRCFKMAAAASIAFMFIFLPKKGNLKQCAYYRTILLSYMQARSFFGSYCKGSDLVKTETETADEQAGFWWGRGQETKTQISEYWCTRHASTNNHSLCALWTSRRHWTWSNMISSGWLW